MGVAAEEEDGDVPVLLAQGGEDGAELVHAQADVAGDDEDVGLLAHGLLEPGLFDRVGDGLNDGVVGVAGEFEE